MKNLEYKINEFMNVKQKSKIGSFLKSKLGRIMSIVILGGTMMLSNVHTINPSEYLSLHIKQPGYKQMIGDRHQIINYDDVSFKIGNKKIVWNLPKPVVTVYKTDMNKVYDVNAFYPMKEYIPKNPWNKFRNFWAGQYGMGYEGINFNVGYVVKESWKTFNADGKGELRLEQMLLSKIMEHMEEQSKEFRENIYKGTPEERIKITKHLSKMFKEGKFKDKLTPLIYPSVFNRLSYGSTYERYSLGMEYLKSIAESKNLDEVVNLVEAENEKLKGLVKKEMEDIKLNPLEFKRLISDIEKNYYELLNKYPELIMNLYHYSLQDYIQEQTFEMIRQTYEVGKEDILTKGLLEKLQKDEDLSKIIEVRGIEKTIKSYCGIALNNHLNRTKKLI